MTLQEKYTWLIGKLNPYGKTLQELSSLWKEETDKELDRTTFNRWRKEIEDVYDIKIECNKSGREYLYYIDNLENLKKPNPKSWLINSLTASNVLFDYKSLEDRVVCDAIPGGIDNLRPLMQAMKANVKVRLEIKSISGSTNKCIVEPYALRQHFNQWYLLCKTPNFKSLQLYNFEQIVKVELLTKDKFKLPNNFDADELFSRFFGVIIMENIKPQTITIRAYGKQANHLRQQPLHPSQTEVSAIEGDFVEFKYYVAPTPDFIDCLFGFGPKVEVIEPEQVRFEIEQRIKSMANRYFGYTYSPESEMKPLNGDFVALGIEVANAELTSICSLAAVIVRNGEIVRKFHSYVRPEPYHFDDCGCDNISEKEVCDAPTFPEVWAQVSDDIKDLPIVAYFTIDEAILQHTFEYYGLYTDHPKKIITLLNEVRRVIGQDASWSTLSSVYAEAGAICDKDETQLTVAEQTAAIALKYF